MWSDFLSHPCLINLPTWPLWWGKVYRKEMFLNFQIEMAVERVMCVICTCWLANQSLSLIFRWHIIITVGKLGYLWQDILLFHQGREGGKKQTKAIKGRKNRKTHKKNKLWNILHCQNASLPASVILQEQNFRESERVLVLFHKNESSERERDIMTNIHQCNICDAGFQV